MPKDDNGQVSSTVSSKRKKDDAYFILRDDMCKQITASPQEVDYVPGLYEQLFYDPITYIYPKKKSSHSFCECDLCREEIKNGNARHYNSIFILCENCFKKMPVYDPQDSIESFMMGNVI